MGKFNEICFPFGMNGAVVMEMHVSLSFFMRTLNLNKLVYILKKISVFCWIPLLGY